eukprot:gb/GECH01010374.1/.p1 GENE.gb/GECH01010374.1/~~gb/GECH01010374.1/.p1  ORF type:complete len:249 (+),score=25.53 gb/GECH01010374.1/:1-747(+)
MPLLQHSERDEFSKIDVKLAIGDQILSIIGSTLLLIGLPVQIPHGFLPPAKAILIIESSFFIAGCILSIIGSCVTFRWEPRSVKILCTCSLLAALIILIGCIIFLISKLLSISQVKRFIFIGDIVSIIGSFAILVGIGFNIGSDQLAIYRATPDEGRQYKIINALLLIGGDLYLVGALLYIIASAVHVADHNLFETLGQILYCIGGVFFETGACFKLCSNIVKYRTTDYDKESSLNEFESLQQNHCRD